MELAATQTRAIEDRIALARNAAIALVVAAAVFALAYPDGGFEPTTKAYAGIAAWWILGAGAAIGLGAARARVGRLPLAAVGLLAGFAVWTLVSMAWSDGGRAFQQFNEISLYVAVLAIAVVLARLVPASVLVGGVVLGLVGIACVAFVSRVFPSSFGAEAGSTILPSINNRLSFPLGYWNGLGIELAIAYPLLLALMASRRSRLVSLLAALPLPLFAADMYLTSSRGAYAATAVAVGVYLVLAPNRWPALAAAAVAAAAGVVAVAVLLHRNAFVSAQKTTTAVSEGHHAAFVIGIACLVAAAVWLGLAEVGRRLRSPSRSVGLVTAAVLVAAVIAGIVALHPVGRFEAFKQSSHVYGRSGMTFTEEHLLSTAGGGRWQFWSAAMSEFDAHPLNGGGAGTWEYQWLEHGSLGVFSMYPHSLYLGALAELGVIGLLLIAGAVLVAVGGAIRSALTLGSGEVAAAAASGIAFFFAAAYDWIWQLSGIVLVGLGMLGLALGARSSSRATEWKRSGALRPLLALVAVAAIIPQVVVLAAGIHLGNSQAAIHAGNGARAKSEALAAKEIEPWSGDTWLQLAQVEEQLTQYTAAHTAIESAIRRSPDNWQVWLAALRIDADRGDDAAVRRDLAKVRQLNPNAPFLQANGS